MGKFSDFLTGSKVLEEIESAINGKIVVVKGLGYGVHVQVGGLTQSGGVVTDVWKSTLNKIQNFKTPISKRCLILGLGAGSAAKLVRNFFPDAKISGVDIDPIFINIGKKYFGMEEIGLNIINDDAIKFVRNALEEKNKYDLILIDMYVGDRVPTKFEKEEFVKDVKKLLAKNGCVVFNRLFYGEKRKEARKFGELLEKNFKQVIYHYPQANLMLICIR